MNKYHLRFNTKHEGSDLVWRVFENGVEHLASDVRIIGETFTECTQEHGQTKWNIACFGRMMRNKDKIVIVANNQELKQDMKKILIMGLPGSGKTYLAQALKKYLEEHGEMSYSRALCEQIGNFDCQVNWFNADEVRKKYNDWDFTDAGRIRQSLRMAQFALEAGGDYVICDFVAPLVEMRNNFKADWTIWMDTIDAGRYEDTNKAFIPPEVYDFRVTEQNCEKWAEFIGNHIIENRRRPVFNWQSETVQMLGRWQPWHPGHRALFERAIAKTGQVVIQIRDCQGWQGSNPFAIEQVKANIKRDLDPLFQGQYEIQVVPNITNITYGRDVGYKIEQETFDDATHNISATKIRKEMGLT